MGVDCPNFRESAPKWVREGRIKEMDKCPFKSFKISFQNSLFSHKRKRKRKKGKEKKNDIRNLFNNKKRTKIHIPHIQTHRQ